MSSKETEAAQWTTWVIVFSIVARSESPIPRNGFSMSPSTNRNFFAARPTMPSRERRRSPRSVERGP